MAAALALLALLTGRRRLGGTVALCVGVYAVVLSASVMATSVVTEWGTIVVAAGGCLAAIGGAGLLLQRASRVSA